MQKNTVESVNQTWDKSQPSTFTEFYIQFFKKLIIESSKYVKDVHIAEEIVQDVFLKIWEKSENLAQIQSIKSYLYKSVINASINYINRQKSLALHHEKIVKDFTVEDLDDLDAENELIVTLYAEIEKLPQKCKQIFKMNRFDRLKYREIAQQLEISERTVENHIAHALKVLKRAMVTDKSSNYSINDLKALMFILSI